MDADTLNNIRIKAERQAKQPLIGVKPTAKWCRTCVHALPDTEWTVGAEKGICDMFVSPESKPHDVMWEDAECEYYEERD